MEIEEKLEGLEAAENQEVTEDLETIGNLEVTEDLMEDDEQRSYQRRQRIEEMKRQKRRIILIHRCVLAAVLAVLLLTAGIEIGVVLRAHKAEDSSVSQESDQPLQADGEKKEGSEPAEDSKDSLQGGDFKDLQDDFSESFSDAGEEFELEEPASHPEVFEAFFTETTDIFLEEIVSEYGVFIDVESQTILADRRYKARMNPASMTKILTVLTAAEVLGIVDGTEDVLDDTFTMTIEITDYCFENDCSIAGFSVDEEIPVRDLFYGTVLPSGADAAVGLAVYIAGSHEAFVELMNKRLEEMGLSASTHFTNCVGLYDEEHYSTAYDIAVILKDAAEHPFCREILSAHTYNTALTEQHPEGIEVYNRFLLRIEDRDTHGEVLCAKTGYVTESGNCAASLSVDGDGREYICVTAGSNSVWQCIDDQTMLYEKYLPASQ